MLTLIRGGEVYTPKYIGKKDILICNDKIEAIDKEIKLEGLGIDIKEIDATGKLVFPGFIDSHVHILGGGGEGGFATRTPEIRVKDILSAGVTTVIGVLGTDGITRNMMSLIAKTRGLEEEGVSTYVYSGSYELPLKTLTGEVKSDMIICEKVIGAGEIALSDHRSSHPSFEEFIKLVSDVRIGGILSGKAGVVNIHMGDGKRQLEYVYRMIEETDIPITQVLPTHMGRNKDLLEEAVKFGNLGGYVDFTTSTTEEFIKKGDSRASKCLKYLLDNGVSVDNITFSSDAQGSLPVFDDEGKYIGIDIGKCSSLYEEVRSAIIDEKVPIEKALKVITTNPATVLKLKYKGAIIEKNDADIVIVNKKSLKVESVLAKGSTYEI